MNKILYPAIILLAFLAWPSASKANDPVPDTVSVGIYITSIHDIDFKQKEYTITFWLWLKYRNRDFDFISNLEIPQAKTVEQSFSTIDSSGEKVYVQMKLQCVMKDSWRIENFPFDKQRLRLAIENSQFDSRSLIFVPDTVGNHFDKRFTLRGWSIDSCNISTGKKAYETAFGDDEIKNARTEYSTFRVRMTLNREAHGLFWKMFLGMYIAFMIAFVCFFIHTDMIDARFGLSVGAMFAVIGNKYIIDSSLPESTSFTLVDSLHGVTLLFIFAVVTATAWSLKLVKANKQKQAARFDWLSSLVLLMLYVVINFWLISDATRG